ncbi:MAG: hypothetical protein ACRDDY_03295 [Clostridium sp.]|uniref:hypothetical protein n=1 Tax=Clostridium sp. TaxID=1506 RepID=UPI003EE73F2B
MNICEVEKQMAELRAKHRANGSSHTLDPNYQALVIKRNKLNKLNKKEEIFKAKLRDLIYANNSKTSGKMSMKDMVCMAKMV